MNNNMTKIEEIKAKIEAMRTAKENTAKAQESSTLSNIITTAVERVLPVSDAQIKTYIQLCQQKGQNIDMKYRGWDGRKNGEMDKAIKALLLLPTIKRPSESQINMLKEICTRNNWEEPAYAHLTGGREGSMSALLNELVLLERETQRLAPPTTEQIEKVLEMYYCTDVDMSDLHSTYGIEFKKDASGKVWFTRASQEHIKETITDLVTHQEVSDFIRKYQVQYYKWKTTRLSQAQMNRIRTLQEKCGMKPMEEYQLMQFDRDSANKYIISDELVHRDREITKFQQEKIHNDSEFRTIKDVTKLSDASIEAKESLLHSIYAMMGMCARDEELETFGDDELRDLCTVAVDLCTLQPVYDLLIEVYTLDEVKHLLNLKDEVACDTDEYTVAEQEMLELISILTISTIKEERDYLKQAVMDMANKHNDAGLITEEVYEIAVNACNV